MVLAIGALSSPLNAKCLITLQSEETVAIAALGSSVVAQGSQKLSPIEKEAIDHKCRRRLFRHNGFRATDLEVLLEQGRAFILG